MTENSKTPIHGVVSVILSSISMVFLLILIPVGMAPVGETGAAILHNMLYLCMLFAFLGIVFGLAGLKGSKRILSIIGILCGVLFFLIFAVIMTSIG